MPLSLALIRRCSIEYRKTKTEEESSLIVSHLYGQRPNVAIINNNNNPRLNTLTETASSFFSRISSASLNPGNATKCDASVNFLKEQIVHPA